MESDRVISNMGWYIAQNFKTMPSKMKEPALFLTASNYSSGPMNYFDGGDGWTKIWKLLKFVEIH